MVFSTFWILLTVCALNLADARTLPGNNQCQTAIAAAIKQHEIELNKKYLFVLRPRGGNLPTDASALAMENNDSVCSKKPCCTVPVEGQIPKTYPIFKVPCQANKLSGRYAADFVLYLKKVTAVSNTNPKEEWKLYKRYLNRRTVKNMDSC